MASLTINHEKASAFFPRFERKEELQHQTHYCPGCGHGIAHKLLAQALGDLGVQDRTVLISPVGCSVFAYYYFDVGNIQAAHGRAPAVATAVKRSHPESIVISYQGDGDLAAIGTAEIIHAANRGEPITVIFVNNGIYGMTGGQMAPTTPLGKKSTTSPYGRNAQTEGYPLHVCELLNTLEAPVFIERVSLGSTKHIMAAAKTIRRAVENQVKGLGFSFVEVLSPCPTIWKFDPVDAQRFVRDEMAKIFPVANYRDRARDAAPRMPAPAPPPAAEIPALLGLTATDEAERAQPDRALDLRMRVAGFGGQGVLTLGYVLAEAGMEAGYQVSWLPSYGPEMRSGTSNCHVRLSDRPISSPLVSRPNVLLALNEPSLRKFLPDVEEGGIVLYNGDRMPADCERPGVRTVAKNFSALADGLGDPKVGNIVMLGALLEAAGLLDPGQIVTALQALVKNKKYLDLDLLALQLGQDELRQQPLPVSDDDLWGI
ncbi:MAG TPA: 2-oxoacid:acceptor oxidoreductase family protein [Bryobacteraceae bacterium]|jgi:2-oxoisovalerate ferredoxin oxidoreductase beta subunit|nr:2-oxoacid:acceptor oxidoreductase family protein [Bryobacteraceae bacterium]